MIRASKITLVSAIAVTLVGGMGTSTQASANAALTVAADAGVGTPPIPSVPGGWLNNDQLGDVLVFPYYTVLDNANGQSYRTTFTVTNTDAAHVVVVKFRLRDSKNSQDVLDFMWILSPGDEVVASMDRNPNGQPQVNFPAEEATCRVPWLNGAHTFTAPGGTVSVADAQTGHLEIVPVASLTPAPGSLAAKAVHGPNQDCNTLSQVFLQGTNTTLPGTLTAITTSITASSAPTPVNNVLRGAYSITNAGGGYSGGGNALAVANWDNAGPATGLLFGQNALAATPTLLNGKDTHQFDHPHLGDLVATQFIDRSAIAAASVINNWSVNPANGVGIDWVVTYYTKYLYQDVNGFYGSAAPYVWPVAASTFAAAVGAGAYDPTAADTIGGTTTVNTPWSQPRPGTTASATIGGTCVRIGLTSNATQIRDREEDVIGVQGGISPGPPASTVDICNEANVIGFSQNGSRKPVLLDTGAVVIDTTGLLLPFGWTDLQVNSTVPVTAGVATGAPVVKVAVGGFSFTLRDLGDPTLAFGSITDHDLRLAIPAPPQ